MRDVLVLLTMSLLAISCQSEGRRTAEQVLLAGWSDVPIPRGFEPVKSATAEAALEIGEYRSGDFVLEGRGRAEDVEAYYLDRLPLHGWAWDPQHALWTKPPTTLSVSVTEVKKNSYGNTASWSRIRLQVRSKRPGAL